MNNPEDRLKIDFVDHIAKLLDREHPSIKQIRNIANSISLTPEEVILVKLFERLEEMGRLLKEGRSKVKIGTEGWKVCDMEEQEKLRELKDKIMVSLFLLEATLREDTRLDFIQNKSLNYNLRKEIGDYKHLRPLSESIKVNKSKKEYSPLSQEGSIVQKKREDRRKAWKRFKHLINLKEIGERITRREIADCYYGLNINPDYLKILCEKTGIIERCTDRQGTVVRGVFEIVQHIPEYAELPMICPAFNENRKLIF